jgi:hypothetical protein
MEEKQRGVSKQHAPHPPLLSGTFFLRALVLLRLQKREICDLARFRSASDWACTF